MSSEQIQCFAEEMMELGRKGDAQQKYGQHNDNGPDVLPLFRGKHLLRDVFYFRFLLFVDIIGFGHGNL